ncbi:MAG: PDZ domain-containing protein [Clostridiales bacterium]|nr:PDZ domain-containing protein [Clostridiales bacterium]
MEKTKKIFCAALAFTVMLFAMLVFTSAPKAVAVEAAAGVDDMIVLGGMTFGMKIDADGAIVVGTKDYAGIKSPASTAGIRRGDIIIKVNDESVGGTRELVGRVEKSTGDVKITFLRSGKEKTVSVTPVSDESGKRRIGVLVRDSAAGIGTITYIDPETLTFAGLGHGITDSESGSLLPISYGSAEKIKITGINPGKTGAPGEIRGAFAGERIGRITKNEQNGVYGVLSEMPTGENMLIEAANTDDVTDGKAYIRTDIGGSPELYEIELTKIGDGKSKNYAIRITDERLIALSGGIVQGMSGSPIVQNDKLIGAVTHVLVSDPTEGYGIFIGNMLMSAVFGEYEDSAA